MKRLTTYITEALDGTRMKYVGKNSEFVDAIIENQNGEILILRRANYMKNFRTCWSIVGGAIDKNDKDSKEAIIREIKEETGIELSFNEQNNMIKLFDYTYKNGNNTEVYYVKLDSDYDIKISREHSKYEWIDFSQEKIDARKWVPEAFNILQKWEESSINEKLVINKNYANPENELINDIKKLDWKCTNSSFPITLKN